MKQSPIVSAQAQAKRIIEHARKQADAIRAQALKQAKTIQEREVARRARNHEIAVELTEQAKLMRDHAARLFRINLANTLTLLNGVSGFVSILLSIEHHYLAAASLILCGVLFDWLDGKAARKFGEETPLGAQLDSLSDLVTFGVAPAVLVAIIHPGFLAFFAGALFVLSAALRLGRFNVQQVRGVYFGLPTTTNGLLLPFFVFMGLDPHLFAWYLLVMAFLMNAPITIKKLF